MNTKLKDKIIDILIYLDLTLLNSEDEITSEGLYAMFELQAKYKDIGLPQQRQNYIREIMEKLTNGEEKTYKLRLLK